LKTLFFDKLFDSQTITSEKVNKRSILIDVTEFCVSYSICILYSETLMQLDKLS